MIQAQHTSVLGRFDVDFVKGCTGMTINVSLNDPKWAGGQFWYEGFDGKAGELNTSHTYAVAGDFYVTMSTNIPGEEDLDSIQVVVSAPDKPNFTIHNCSSHTIRVEIEDDHYDSYFVEYTTTDNEVVAPLSLSTAYNYGTQGSYRIDVTGRYNGGSNTTCGTDNKGFNSISTIVSPELTSVETITESKTGEIQLGYSLAEDIIYNLESSPDGTDEFTFKKEVTGAATVLTNLNTEDDFYCYRINTYDACNNLTLLSDIICSVYFDVAGTEQANTITWQTDTVQAQSYDILRDGKVLASITNTSLTSYDDSEVICNKEYIYNVQPRFKNNGSSLSVDTAVIASKSASLPAIGYPTSTINIANEVELTWGPPDTGEIPFRRYIIERNIRDRAWKYYDASDDTTYVDTEATFSGEHAYRIRYDDDCGNLATPSPATIPIIIEQGAVRGKEVNFNWNKYETWLNGIRNYTIERIDESGQVLEEYQVFSGREKVITFSPNDSEDKLIRVRAESLDPTPTFTYSNVILTELSTSMFMPNAFTPDDDGVNDILVAKGPLVFNFKLEIYNRWGALIFSTTDNFNGWDGRIRDQEADEGTYIYRIYYEDAEGRSFDQSGSVLLMRKG
ncbi:gliding motility-associated C-terminal domain-containing protein [Reichenbachiella carrageenanivorans]|uniref:Gliding motility-associated C-terminal domain-containing protein n=1 Tax=Reichenbachiella carrageenanivorans TaxID=2979869 RepID=A0ABY6CYF2_9BACT|nr:gliding motility-associated C-terminal domain-containing protein [Reichenbachiella carrageenanivorans]UXX78942.1 gliding motility-associated C-terminal domain-containing protein [Reichenbachiella carrageenanivorans]